MSIKTVVLVLFAALLGVTGVFAEGRSELRDDRRFTPPPVQGELYQYRHYLPPHLSTRHDGKNFGRNFRNVTPPVIEEVSLTGKLDFVNGHIAVVDNGKTYYVDGVRRLIGFVDGLKEGATISFVGNARQPGADFAHPDEYFVRLTQVTYNNKVYDIQPKVTKLKA